MKLLTYIKELLLLNDCVIIPGFGGFVSNYKSATVQNARFSPPSKAVSFNEKLTFNDGLLINHIVEKEGENYLAVSRKVDLLVQEMNYRLTDGETIEIDGVGSLAYDENENLAFQPVVTANLNLDAYGLGTFEYETLYAKKLVRTQISQEERDAVQVFFQKRTLKKVLVAVPLLFALAVAPVRNNTSHLQQSNLTSLTEMMTMREVVQRLEPRPAVVETAVAEQPTIAVEDHHYFIIGGSFRSEANANKFMQQKQTEGFKAKNIGFIKGLHYIALDSFASFKQAKAAQSKIKTESPGSGVWIYVKR
ncbi:HU domain-containing protein [Sunxiuqinia elliptica]|uniref:Sporulation related domain-containing protein n=1 Tax=Sunxiuqinia elliptica TaxID=655355 RepID=A0A1I2BRN8_9BACT|nr:SPOR domain-containing protein [Sunxiuqinia elliptica]SFE58735.1 Sporulation related domain-containing protein [Sunxiuqinia elliptica]